MRRGLLAAGLVAAAIAIAAAYQSLGLPATDPAGRAGPGVGTPEAPIVTTAVAGRRDVPILLSAIGTVESPAVVSLKARVEGAVTAVHFTEGEEVRKGDRLFSLDPRPFEFELRQARATLARDEAALERARLDLERYRQLVDSAYASHQQYETAEANVRGLEATVEADRAVVDAAELMLSYAEIRAPVSGRTGAVLVQPGNLVRANDTTPLVTITQMRPVLVRFGAPERDLPAVRAAMKARPPEVLATAPEDGGEDERGRLVFIDNAIDRTTGTIELRAEFANADESLWPGQFVNVTLVLGAERDAVTVPSEAVQAGQDGPYVFVVEEDSRVAFRPVTVSRTAGAESVIAGGLLGGERVVVEGQLRLADGMAVEDRDAAAPPALAAPERGIGPERPS